MNLDGCEFMLCSTWNTEVHSYGIKVGRNREYVPRETFRMKLGGGCKLLVCSTWNTEVNSYGIKRAKQRQVPRETFRMNLGGG